MRFEPGTKVKWQVEGGAWIFGIVMGQDPYNTANLIVRHGGHTWQVNNNLLHLDGKKEDASA